MPSRLLSPLALAACLATPALAHVTLDRTEAAAGAGARLTLRVPHGCGDKATTGLVVAIPEGVLAVAPMPKTGWTLKATKAAYARPQTQAGKPVTEGVAEIAWTGGDLPSHFYDEFVLVGRIADGVAVGTKIAFPVTQLCADGAVARWQGADAPTLVVAPAAPAEKVWKVGDLTIATPWARATPGGAKVAGGYVRITNAGAAPDRLIGAEFALAGRVEVHETTMEDGVMRMRPIDGGLTIAPGAAAELKPGGAHLMFMDLTGPAKAGDAIRGALIFEKAGRVAVEFAVAPIGAGGPPETHRH